jgi:peptidoglycan/LPS O-acetylase OafA/YrhL
MAVFIAMMLLFTFDGPLFGTEPKFNTLRVFQMSVVGSAVWGFLSRSRLVHTAISLLVLLALGAVVIIRFLPGGGNR